MHVLEGGGGGVPGIGETIKSDMPIFLEYLYNLVGILQQPNSLFKLSRNVFWVLLVSSLLNNVSTAKQRSVWVLNFVLI